MCSFGESLQRRHVWVDVARQVLFGSFRGVSESVAVLRSLQSPSGLLVAKMVGVPLDVFRVDVKGS